MITHQVQNAHCTQVDDCGSLPDSLPAQRLASLTGAPEASLRNPSDSSLSLPPGPPSSASSGPEASYGQELSTRRPAQQSTRMARLAEGAGAQSSAAALTVLEMASEPEVMEAVLTDLMADEEAVLELQGMLGSPPAARTHPEMVAGVRVVRQRVVAHRVQEAVNSTPPTPPEATLAPDAEWLAEVFNELDDGHNDGGAGSEPQEPHLPVGPPGSLDPDQGSITPRQRALHVARQHLRIARTNIESFLVVQTLAVALGASQVEGGTIKALHAVLLQMDRPGMSEKEAYTSTGASRSSFLRWRKRVLCARLDLPPPP
jgi:hypothetical protein